MPIREKKDSSGHYYQWGNHGGKYYFDPKDNKDKQKALKKAQRQARAIYAHGYRDNP